MSAGRYDRVIKQLDASGAGDPPGRRLHASFGPAHHLTVFDVWHSAQEFPAFGLTLMPILAKERIEMAPVEALQIHGPIEGGEASVLRETMDEHRDRAFFLRPVERLREKIHKAPEKSSGVEDEPSGSATT